MINIEQKRAKQKL